MVICSFDLIMLERETFCSVLETEKVRDPTRADLPCDQL